MPIPDQKHLSVGYADGVIEVFDVENYRSVCIFAPHRSAVSVLNSDLIGLKLISGGLDISDVVVQMEMQLLLVFYARSDNIQQEGYAE